MAAGQYPAGGNQQRYHDGRHALLKCTYRPQFPVLVAPAGGREGQRGAGQQNADHGNGHAQRAIGPRHKTRAQASPSVHAHIPAQQRDKQHIGPGCGLGQGDRGGKLAIAEPLPLIHEVAVHVGCCGDGAPNGQQRQ